MQVTSACEAGHIYLRGEMNDISDKGPYAAAHTCNARALYDFM